MQGLEKRQNGESSLHITIVNWVHGKMGSLACWWKHAVYSRTIWQKRVEFGNYMIYGETILFPGVYCGEILTEFLSAVTHGEEMWGMKWPKDKRVKESVCRMLGEMTKLQAMWAKWNSVFSEVGLTLWTYKIWS